VSLHVYTKSKHGRRLNLPQKHQVKPPAYTLTLVYLPHLVFVGNTGTGNTFGKGKTQHS